MLGIGILLGLALTIEPVKKEVKLGEPVELRVFVKNDGKDAFTGPEVTLDKRSVTLTIGEGAKQFIYQRKNDKDPEQKTAKGGETLSGTISWPPTRAGTYPLEANYAGKAAGETKVTVTPTEGGATELGMLMVTTKGEVKFRFLPEVAPNHVAHFAERARTGFYTGTVFHRVLQNFMAQGGDPTGTGSGGPGYSIPSEFSNDPQYSHTFGRLSTARTRDPNSAGSQFFVCFGGAQQLDGQYTVLGEVFEGKETVKKLEEIGSPRDPMPPKERVKITNCTLIPIKAGS